MSRVIQITPSYKPIITLHIRLKSLFCIIPILIWTLLIPGEVRASTISANTLSAANLKFYGEYSSLKTKDLYEMAKEYDRRNSVDSALVCYSVIADRYLAGSAPEKDLKICATALNNLGYIYASYFFDVQKALQYFQESLELSEKINYEASIAYVYFNMGGVYLDCAELDGGTTFTREILDYSIKSLDAALKVGDNMLALAACLNVGLHALDESNWKTLALINEGFSKIREDSDSTLYPYTKEYFHGLNAMKEGRDGDALSYFTEAQRHARDFPMIQTKLEMYALYGQSRALAAMRRYGEAIARVDSMAVSAKREKLSNDIARALGWKARYYEMKGDLAGRDTVLLEYYRSKEEMLLQNKFMALSRVPLQSELRQMNRDMAREIAARERAVKLAIAISLVAVVVITLATLLLRAHIKQKRYAAGLYKKNMELIEARERERGLRRDRIAASSLGMIDAKEDFATASSDIRDSSEKFTSGGEQSDSAHATPRYDSSRLRQEDKAVLEEKILGVMDDTETICATTFSLQQLSQRVGSNQRYVSQVINEMMGKNFKTLLNEYRVREACRRLSDREGYGHLTIEHIAESVGFASRSNFTVTFKAVTGLTPSEFQRSGRRR